jgi:YD repeat-containing protein
MSTSLCLRITVLTIIFAMLVPAVLIGDLGPVKVRAASNVPAPVSAPAEPFLVQGSEFKVQSLLAFGVHSLLSYALADTRASALEPQSVSQNSQLSTLNSPLLTPPPPGSVRFDFDGDGKADIGRWHATTTEFKVKNSFNGTFTTSMIGTTAARSCPADFDGDGKTDQAVFYTGTWKIRKSSNGTIQTITGFGQAGDIPLPGNYRGSTAIDAAVFRPSNNTWYFRDGATGALTSQVWGAAGDIPVPGNYNGDALTDVAVYRPATGVWYIVLNGGGNLTYTWGTGSDIPVPADYDADNKTDVAVYRRTSGTWYVIGSHPTTGMFSQVWGNYGDQPTPADYDGDGKADFSIWRPTTGKWYTINSLHSTNQQYPQFSYDTLGVAGDTAVPSSYIKQIGGTVSPSQLASERLSPKNATGGTDLYSRNFAWGTSLAGLPGRAGMNAGFGIGYNSLVWTKSGSEIYFDTDAGNVSPGFRIGFPTIEPAYYDSVKGAFAYLMVTPSGGRVEFRQIAATGYYETVDSSYARLLTSGAANPNDPVENITITVTSTDGTQMKYLWKGGAFRCMEIKDRNGNYITLVYDDYGLLQTMTDTLGRIVTVVYDTSLYPVTVKQSWQNGDHNYATLAYTNVSINTNFTTPITSVIGPPNGTVIKALEKITYADLSYTKFTYNSYGQVWKVQNFAADNHELNYVKTNLETPGTSNSDCPRLGQSVSWVENFNSGNPITVTNTLTASQPYSVGGLTGTGARIDVTMTGNPDGLYSRTFVGETGWKEGLPLATEDCIGANCAQQKRWTWTDYIQDNIALAYILNPRVKEARVGDSANVKKTAVEYLPVTTGSPVALYGLVSRVEVFDTGLTNVIKRVETDYLLTKGYTDRNIIGLPSETRAWGKNDLTNNLEQVSRVTYGYDEGTFSQEPNQIIAPTRHDTANYGSTFTKRGNPTSTTRWEVPNNVTSVTSQVRYDIAGSPVAQIDPLGRKVRIGYADNFQPTQSFTTFAYPTVITDPAGTSLGDNLHSSTVKYRYDIGANVEAISPAPAGNTLGKKTTRLFDTYGRLEKETIVNSGAYTRYEYPTNGIQSKVFSTIIDTNANGADALDEVMSESWSDGAGRVRRSRTEHPGSIGGWSASVVEYDILGRAKRQSVPTEISVPNANDPDTWTPAGDDATRGWLWTYQKYDWKGRVVRKINTDGTDSPVLNDSDVLISYEGCGCAGGQITTIEGENIIETDWQGSNPNTLGRRKQKVYEDILGRQWKTETLNWNGSVYSTNTVQFNGRDQALAATQTEQSTSISQITSMTYDGHGRLVTQHNPVQDANKSSSYEYYVDDRVHLATDARGARTTYVYNNRGLVQQINYSVPPVPENSAIHVPQDVNLTYDNVGNRTQMTDETGTVDYQYNQLSQLTSETKHFAGITNGFTLAYSYALSGQLKSITNPDGTIVSYATDRIGRLSAVNGQGFEHKIVTWQSGGTPTYTTYNINQIAHSIQYRAWGAIKHGEFQDGRQYDITYNNKLLPYEYVMPDKMSKRYSYYADGNLSFARDLLDNRNDRSFSFDQVGRMTKNYGGYVARGEQPNYSSPNWFDLYVPVKNDYVYNGFSNPTSRKEANSTMYRTDIIQYQTLDVDELKNYTNNRAQKIRVWDTDWVYDSDGRFVEEIGSNGTSRNKLEYDAAGQPKKATVTDGAALDKKTSSFDGNGMSVKDSMFVSVPQYDANGNPAPPFESTNDRRYLRSTALGGAVVSLIYEDGGIAQTNVYAGGRKIGTYFPNTGSYAKFHWEHSDPHGISGYGSSYDSNQYWPGAPNDDLTLPGKKEYEPNGMEIGRLPNQSDLISTGGGGGTGWSPGEVGGGWENMNCTWDGVNVPCGWLQHYQNQGGGGPVVEAPPDNTAAIWSNSLRRFVGLAVWNANAAENGIAFLGRGSLGWLPTNVSYTPGSGISGENVYQWFGGFAGGRLGSSDSNPNFISETSVQLHSMAQGIALNGANFSSGGRAAKGANDIHFEYLTDEEKRIKEVKDIVDYALSKKECTKAFEAAGVTTIKDQLNNLTIVTQNIFQEPLYDRRWTKDSDVGKTMRAFAKQKPNSSDYAWPGPYGDTGTRFIGLPNRAFTNTVGPESEHLSVVVIHSLIHSGGKEGKDSQTWGDWVNGETPHDLKYLGQEYKDILKYCTKERGSKMLWGQ